MARGRAIDVPAATARTRPDDPVDDSLKRNLIQFVKSCVVGGSGILVNLAVFSLTLFLWDAVFGETTTPAKYLGNALGFVVSVLTNYYLNRRWTLRSRGAVSRELPKFFVISIIACLATLDDIYEYLP